MRLPPESAHVTFGLQYRTCGHKKCRRCQSGERHGPYIYAEWYEEGRVQRTAYVGMPGVLYWQGRAVLPNLATWAHAKERQV